MEKTGQGSTKESGVGFTFVQNCVRRVSGSLFRIGIVRRTPPSVFTEKHPHRLIFTTSITIFGTFQFQIHCERYKRWGQLRK